MLHACGAVCAGADDSGIRSKGKTFHQSGKPVSGNNRPVFQKQDVFASCRTDTLIAL